MLSIEETFIDVNEMQVWVYFKKCSSNVKFIVKYFCSIMQGSEDKGDYIEDYFSE